MKLTTKTYGNLITEGGEGFIYSYNNQILKIYKDNVNYKDKEEKLKLLMNVNLPPSVIKPVDLVYDKNNEFIGYLMNKAEGDELKKLSNKKFIISNNITKKDISELFISIKNDLIEIHKHKIFISDFNDQNILFDQNKNIYFIDVDSWTIGNFKCDVAMDMFKDPLLKVNNFTETTDYYAYAVMLFKSLTRLHPFGGVLNKNDIDMGERINKRISVINRINEITIPSTVDYWNFLSPDVLNELNEIFEKDKRFLIDKSFDDLHKNLIVCKKHNDFYYNKFDKCPVCFADSKLNVYKAPEKKDDVSGIPYRLFYTANDIKVIFNEDCYLNTSNQVVYPNLNDRVSYYRGNYYYQLDKYIITVSKDNIFICSLENSFNFNKAYNSQVIVTNNKIYYVNTNNSLLELNITNQGNYENMTAKTSFKSMFEVIDRNVYFIVNDDSRRIINNSGSYFYMDDKDKIVNWTIKHDSVKNNWLFIYENTNGKFKTFIYSDRGLIWRSDKLKFSCDLNNLAFFNGIIYIPAYQEIVGFNYEKNIYKEFHIEVVTEDSKLIKTKNVFTCINITEIYKIGG